MEKESEEQGFSTMYLHDIEVTEDGEGDLLDVETKGITSWTIVKSMIKQEFIERGSLKHIEQEIPQSDEDALVIWPARGKTDLALRRLRYTDIFTYITQSGKENLVRVAQQLINTRFDYITVCNLLIYTIILGIKWFDFWDSIAAFVSDINHMTAVMKRVSDIIKTSGAHLVDWEIFVECSGVSGYRNLPYAGFDYVKEVNNLANAGENHLWSENKKWFEDYCHKQLYKLPRKWNKKLTFLEFLESDIWLTSGSSSIGHYEVEIEGKLHKIKCKKNMIRDILTPVELRRLCLNHNTQENSVIVKNELGKVRLAVASDVLTYFSMAYIGYCSSGFYENWDGVVSGESVNKQLNRLDEMIALCRSKFGMPYDYAGFDHQPQTHELQAIYKVMGAVGRQNTPDHYEYETLFQNTYTGFAKAKLYSRSGVADDNVEMNLPVRGGLMSGLYITAIVGNGWNKVVTDLNLDILAMKGINTSDLVSYIKGDDSSFFSGHSQLLQKMEKGYREMNIKGGEGKFSIMWGKNEFLRTWMAERCYGYAGRIIPGLMQRKPWSNTPWSGSMVLDALYKDIQILRRRLPANEEIDKFWLHVSKTWCKLHKLDSAVITIPKTFGGLGLGEWDGVSVVKPHIPQLPKYNITVKNSNNVRKEKIMEVSNKFGLGLNEDDAESLAQNEMSAVLVSDDLPSVSRSLREKWKTEVAHTTYKIVKIQKQRIENVFIMPMIDTKDSEQFMLKQTRSSFGSLKYEVNLLLSLKPYLAKVGKTIKSMIMGNATFSKLKNVYTISRNPHLGEFLDWYGGNVSVSTYSLNPLLNKMFTSQLTHCIRNRSKRFRNLTTLLNHNVLGWERVVTQCALYQRICQW